jgi:hypothetical protein
MNQIDNATTETLTAEEWGELQHELGQLSDICWRHWQNIVRVHVEQLEQLGKRDRANMDPDSKNQVSKAVYADSMGRIARVVALVRRLQAVSGVAESEVDAACSRALTKDAAERSARMGLGRPAP